MLVLIVHHTHVPMEKRPLAAAVGAVAVVRVASVWLWRPRKVEPAMREQWCRTARVAAVVPSYNEQPEAVIRTIRSLYAGTHRPDTVFVVDDGSKSRDGVADLIWRASRSAMDVRVLPMARNAGKRFAQTEAWLSTKRGEFDMWLIIDSDTTVAPRAVERMVAAFADSRIEAATSLILPRNRGLMALMQEVEYARCVLVGRLLWNWLGAVEVISGGFSAVRDHVVRDNLDRYLEGFWGTHLGDDRHMAILANATGRVVVIPESRSYTEVPTGMRKLVKQRTRWARSYFLGVAWAVRYMPRSKIAAVMAWLMGYSVVGYVLIGYVAARVSWTQVPSLLLWVSIVSWVQAYRYLREPSPDPRRQFLAWLISPLQTMFGMFVLTPVKVWALLTCRRNAWGTR